MKHFQCIRQGEIGVYEQGKEVNLHIAHGGFVALGSGAPALNMNVNDMTLPWEDKGGSLHLTNRKRAIQSYATSAPLQDACLLRSLHSAK